MLSPHRGRWQRHWDKTSHSEHVDNSIRTCSISVVQRVVQCCDFGETSFTRKRYDTSYFTHTHAYFCKFSVDNSSGGNFPEFLIWLHVFLNESYRCTDAKFKKSRLRRARILQKSVSHVPSYWFFSSFENRPLSQVIECPKLMIHYCKLRRVVSHTGILCVGWRHNIGLTGMRKGET